MDNIDSGFKGVSIMMKLAKYLPTIGNLIGTLQTAIQVAKTPFNTAYVKIKAIDDRIRPSMDRIGTVGNFFTGSECKCINYVLYTYIIYIIY